MIKKDTEYYTGWWESVYGGTIRGENLVKLEQVYYDTEGRCLRGEESETTVLMVGGPESWMKEYVEREMERQPGHMWLKTILTLK